MDSSQTAGGFHIALRGLTRRCPRCGRGRLFRRFYALPKRCSICGLDFVRFAHDTWALMYVSTAGLAGLIVFGMIYVRPADVLFGRWTVFAIALTAIPLSLPFRKGLAVAINYISENSRNKPS